MRHLNAVGATILVAGALAAVPSGAAAQSACGGLLQPKCPPAVTTAPTPSPAPPLSPARYQALDALEQLADDDSSGATARLKAACLALDAADPLLAAERTVCLAVVRFVEVSSASAFANCHGGRTCRRAFGRVGRAAIRMATVGEQANKVVVVEVPDGDCRARLVTSASDIRYVRRFGRAAERVSRAKTRRQTLAALNRFAKAAGSDDDDNALASDDLQAFRNACSAR